MAEKPKYRVIDGHFYQNSPDNHRLENGPVTREVRVYLPVNLNPTEAEALAIGDIRPCDVHRVETEFGETLTGDGWKRDRMLATEEYAYADGNWKLVKRTVY